MGSRGYSNEAPASAATGACIGADDFVYMLRHITEAHVRDSYGRGRRLQRPANSQSKELTPGFLRSMRARLECVIQDVLDWVRSTTMLICVIGLKVFVRAVKIGQGTVCACCGSSRARADGQVNAITACHWSLTCMIIQLQGLRREMSMRQQAVADFLCRHRISVPLSARLKKYVGSSLSQHVRESNIPLLQKLSTGLLMDLHEEMRAPALPAHPFFVSLRSKHPHLVRELCNEALVPLLKFSEEIVFSAGEPCLQMYFVANGNLQYTINQQRDADPRRAPEVVRRMLCGGQWLSEAALWTSWVHRGEFRVVTDSLLLALDASGFARVISAHKAAHLLAAAYARKFVETLNRGPQTDLTEPATPPQTPASAERAQGS